MAAVFSASSRGCLPSRSQAASGACAACIAAAAAAAEDGCRLVGRSGRTPLSPGPVRCSRRRSWLPGCNGCASMGVGCAPGCQPPGSGGGLQVGAACRVARRLALVGPAGCRVWHEGFNPSRPMTPTSQRCAVMSRRPGHRPQPCRGQRPGRSGMLCVLLPGGPAHGDSLCSRWKRKWQPPHPPRGAAAPASRCRPLTLRCHPVRSSRVAALFAVAGGHAAALQ